MFRISRTSPLFPIYFGLMLLLLVIGIGAFVMFLSLAKEGAQNYPDATGEVTVEGVLTCLPHKDRSGPTTLECAYGLKQDDGTYVALDMIVYPSSNINDLTMDHRLAVTGTYRSVTEVPNEPLKIYDIEGVIQVSDIEKKE